MKDKRRKYLLLPIVAAVSVAVFSYAAKTPPETPDLNLLILPLNLTIHDTGLKFKVSTRETSVQQLLSELNIKLHPQDSIAPSLKTPLSSGYHIVINREVFKRRVSVPFETLYVKDKDLLYGRKVIRQYGSWGLKEETYLVHADQTLILNADPTLISDEEILEEKILTPPKPKIIAKGTKIVPTGFEELGQASWCAPYYGWGFVAAHPIIKRGSRMLVTNLENSSQVVVKIVDWGPDRSVFPERVIDLSPEAFVKLGMPLGRGIIKEVKIEEIL